MTAAEETIHETEDEMVSRHRKEQRDLVSATTSMKKQATKGEKRKKKEILKQIETMEAELKEKQAKELKVSDMCEGKVMYYFKSILINIRV